MRRTLLLAALAFAIAAAPASAAAPYENPRLPTDKRVEDLLSRMSIDDKVGQMTQTERARVDPDADAGHEPAARLDPVRRRLDARGRQHARGVGRHGRQHAARGARHALEDPAALRRRLRARPRQPAGRDGLPAQHRPRRDARSRTSCARSRRSPPRRRARPVRSGRSRPASARRATTAGAARTRASARTRGSSSCTRPRSTATSAAACSPPRSTTRATATRSSTPPTATYTIDQGIAITSREDFWRHSLRQYVPAVRKHGVETVMPSFSSVDWTEDGVGNPLKMHAHHELITDVLKGRMGFDGFVISDWEAIHQIPGDLNDAGPDLGERGRRHVHGARPPTTRRTSSPR